jgi:hypothetical protein|tara:strand:- start:728 stop:1060 length:333 start_codon:yes stop_codon:yes gene_type:complete
MTKFNKEDFSYHGGYLMYKGSYANKPVYADKPGVHPTRVGTGIDLFIARFKYKGTPLTMSQFRKELIKNHTVESYAELMKTGTPVGILSAANPVWYEKIMSDFNIKYGIA